MYIAYVKCSEHILVIKMKLLKSSVILRTVASLTLGCRANHYLFVVNKFSIPQTLYQFMASIDKGYI